MHAHMARFWKGRTHVHAHVCSRCIGVMCNIALAIRIAVSVSVAFIPYGLRTCGITILLVSKGGYCGERRRGVKVSENCVTPLCPSTLPPKKSCPRSLFFLRATREFTGAVGDYERLIARKRRDSPTLSFPSTSHASERASFNSSQSASNCCSPAIPTQVRLDWALKYIYQYIYWRLSNFEAFNYFFTCNITSERARDACFHGNLLARYIISYI